MSRLETLFDCLGSTDLSSSFSAVLELADLKDQPEVVPSLVEALLQQENFHLATGAAEALAIIADPATTQALYTALTSTSLEQEVQQATAALGHNRDHTGIFALVEHYGSEVLDFKTTVAQALARIGTQEALDLLEYAKSAPDPYGLIGYALDSL